jgi:cold shock CspA family protein
VFAHNSELPDCKFRYLQKGEEVRFRVVKEERGLRAVGVVAKAGPGMLVCEQGK